MIISWILIHFMEGKTLAILGLTPTAKRISDFVISFFVTSFFCTLGFVLKMYFGDQDWSMNPDLKLNLVIEGIWWNIKSVLFEELIFRGVLLYILLKRLGGNKAVVISAIAFGIYHWFSFGIFGSLIPMIIVFFITSIMGLLLAYGYVRTLSLYVPIAIHLGWNLTQNFIFSEGPIGNGIFIKNSAEGFLTNSYFIFAFVTVIPVAGAILINYLFIKRKPLKT